MPTDSNIKASILDRFKITCLSTFFSTICFSILFFQKRQNLFKSGIILIYFGLKIDFPLTLSFTFIFFEDLCLLGCFLYDKGKEILLHQNKVQSSLKAESPIQWAESPLFKFAMLGFGSYGATDKDLLGCFPGDAGYCLTCS